MLTCMMGWLILVITLSSFQLVKLDSVFVGGGGMLGEVVETTQVKSRYVGILNVNIGKPSLIGCNLMNMLW